MGLPTHARHKKPLLKFIQRQVGLHSQKHLILKARALLRAAT